MKHFYGVTNSIKDPDLTFTKEVAGFISDHGGTFACGGECPADAECVLVLGGDGTVLQAAADTRSRQLPLLGINLGTVGYLAEIEKSGWQQALLQLMEGTCGIEERMMLEGHVERGGGAADPGHPGRDTPHYALNDVVFARTGPLRILNYDVYVNGLFLNSFNADGIIVSTPTGSTAYNLSAGGPIVEPGARMILLTPICPHTLNNRSIIFSADDFITIEIGHTSRDSFLMAEADFDGTQNVALRTGDRMVIRRAGITTRLIKLRQRSFLETLHRKLA